MSWRAPLRARASLSYVFLALSMAIVVSCVTVAPTPAPADSPDSTPVLTASPSPASSPTPVPSSTPTEAPSPTLEATEPPTPEPTPTPTPTSTPEPTEPPTPEPTPTSTPEPTEPPTPEPIAVPANSASPAPTVEVAVASPEVSVAPTGLTVDEKTAKRLDTILRNQVKNKEIVGLQAAVRMPSGETWTGSAGNAELTPERAIEGDTQFAIASVTKTFIAALILQLAEEGQLDLDEPFGTYFEDAPRQKKVTIRQLLSHTSGIYNYFEHPTYKAAAKAWWESPNATGLQARGHQWTYEEIMDLVKGGYFKPGEDYHYSNTNYVILGKVAEAIEGEPLHKQLRKRFFKPLGLEDTVYQPAKKPGEDAAHGHWNYGNGYTDHTREAEVIPFMGAISVADAAGAIASTADDLTLWAEKLYGGEVLSEESLEQMTTFLRPGSYGLGTDVATFAGERAYGHRGGLRGYEASMWHFPESGVSIALLSNQGNWLTDDPMEKMAKTVLDSD